ncbi:MAG: filamentous hemagglutinin N-terminal domain-containing protein, partial [Reyranellaceae bacterium]
MTRQRPAHRRVRLSGTTPRLDRRGLLASTAFAAMVGTGLFSFATPVMGQTPTGGVVVGGSATITQNSSTQLTVNQTTARGVIDWQSFSIGAGARVDFIQPGASSVTLNRVIGPDPSLINGQLNANGQIILINPSGVTFGGGAQVNVHSLIAATANVGNVQTFMAGGTVAFDRASANPDAAVINQGTITVKEGGLVGLVGPNAANHGVINARLGRVTIGGAETLTVDLAGDGLLGLQIGPATKVAT